MLKQISIKNLGAIVDTKEIEFDPCWSVITGETGAGKSMLLNAISQITGARALKENVQNGAKSSIVNAEFLFAENSKIIENTKKIGADAANNSLIISRVVNSAGDSKAYIDGIMVTASMLQEIMNSSITIHGQSDQMKLKRPSEQLKLLDKYAKNEQILKDYKKAYNQHNEIKKDLENFIKNKNSLQERVNELKNNIEIIEKANPKDNAEYQEFLENLSRLQQSQELRTICNNAIKYLDPENVDGNNLSFSTSDNENSVGALENLQNAISSFDSNLASSDAKLMKITESMKDLHFQLSDCLLQIQQYLSGLDVDGNKIEEMNERKMAFDNAFRVLGLTEANELVQVMENSLNKLNDIDSGTDSQEKLEEKLNFSKKEVIEKAKILEDSRIQSAKDFEKAIKNYFSVLALKDASLIISIQRLPEFNINGANEVVFLFSGLAGAEARPLTKVASGGELSRIMLAIETILAKKSSEQKTETFVFDEIDTGIGGVTAQKVGQMLYELSRNEQVILVTHLPQIAAMADKQFCVTKKVINGISEIEILELNSEQRVEEIARMLGGNKQSAVAHAKELLNTKN